MKPQFTFVRLAVALGICTSAVALPPPVPVGPNLIAIELDAAAESAFKQALRELEIANWIDTVPSVVPETEVRKCFAEPGNFDECVARVVANSANSHQVAVVVDRPSPRNIRIRCIGTDVHRSKKLVVTTDEFEGAGHRFPEKRNGEFARCIIGALHSSPRS